jgi:photosystem II stability/assembly factor-like uncharacterized protein
MAKIRFPLVALGLAALLSLAAAVRAGDDDDKENKGGPPEFKHIKYRNIGPAAGGRVARSVGVPGDPLTYYAATAAGGVWKSTDGGLHWQSIFDDQPTASSGAIAVAPSDANVVYVGSGEANIRGNVEAGNGIYKSTDAGKTWKHVWKQEGQIGTLIVHPTNPDIAFAAVLGHAFAPNPERGVYRTTDGGKSWKKVLFKDDKTGASDVCFDPTNPRLLFAGLWQTRRRPWELTSGGPGSGLYVSRDGGDTWKQLGPPSPPRPPLPPRGEGGKDDLPPLPSVGEGGRGGEGDNGLPPGPWGKIGVGVSRSDPRRVYAMIEADKGGLYRSDDGGEKWKLASGGHYLRQRAWYYSTFTIDPTNPDIVWVPQVPLLKSSDGGTTWKQVKGPHHGDHHDIWIDPKDPRRIIDSNDGGVDISVTGGEGWFSPPLPISQFYRIAVDNQKPYHVSGPMQDLGTAAGPSNSLSNAGIGAGDWYHVGGGETGHTAPDPANPNIVYATEYGGYLSRYEHRTGQQQDVSIYPENPEGHGAADMKYRFNWTAPVLVSPHDPKVVYHGANVLFKTSDAGKTWKAISPDLTRDDKSKQKWSGGPITGDNTGAEYYCTIYALAESRKQPGLLWVGSDDGLAHVSRDGGQNWKDVTKNIPGLPEWGTISCIEPSPSDAGTAYLVVDAHRLDDHKPYLWKTTDFGDTWKSLTGKLPQDAYLDVVREDPKRKGTLYAGTEGGVVFSRDDGATWQELKLNMPAVLVTDLAVKDNDLVVGTNGRSIWILDDLTPVREWSPPAGQDLQLLPVQPAVSWRYRRPVHALADRNAFPNPPGGAVIHYYLKEVPKEPLTLEVLDAQGKEVARLSSKPEEEEVPEDDPDASDEDDFKARVLPAREGLQRFVWDLRADGATLIKKAKFDGGNPRQGPYVLPGTYTLKLHAGAKTVTGKVEVLLDPRLTLPPEEMREQYQFSLRVRDDISRLARTVERLRLIRKQLNERNELLENDKQAEPWVKQSKELIGKLDALEAKLQNPKAEVSYDILAQRGGAQLYSRLITLYDYSHDSDGPLTEGMGNVFKEESAELARLTNELRALIGGDLAKLNDAAKKRDLPPVFVPPAEGSSSSTPLGKLLREIEGAVLQGGTDPGVEKFPPFAAKVWQDYEADDKMTPLREAVRKASTVQHEVLRGKRFRTEVLAPAAEEEFKLQLRKEQTEVATAITRLQEALEELQQAGTKRSEEKSRRWQAHYDYTLARLEQRIAWLQEYNAALGELRRDLPPRDPKTENGWRLVPSEQALSEPSVRKLARGARQELQKLIEDHPDTPWEALARRALEQPPGLRWQAAKLNNP